jgi:hypothetical protein
MTYDTFMENSTIILKAAALLNEELLHDEAFCGYSDDQHDLQRLLGELWDIFYVSQFFPFTDPEELVSAWYENFYAQQEEAA